MRLRLLALVMALAAVPLAPQALAQRHKLGTVNAETPEGALLQQIGQESDETKKIPMLEEFVAKYPKHEGIAWVYGQLQVLYVKAGQADKALDAGDKLIAIDPDDLEAAYQSLQAAEAKKDPDLVKKWSGVTSQLCQKVAAAPQPKEADEVDAWKRQVDYARQVNTRTEYSLWATALQTPDPRKRVDLAEALEQRNPKSEFMTKMSPIQFAAYRQLNENDKAVALAEKVLVTDPNNEDMLAFVADQYMQKKKEPDKVISYSNKLIDALNAKPKPEGVSDDDWNKKKKALSGLAYFMTGSTLFGQNKLKEADKNLRAALPLVEGNDQMKAATLFFAGLANYKMNNFTDALKFNIQCAAIKSPFQSQASRNVRAIRSQTVPAR